MPFDPPARRNRKAQQGASTISLYEPRTGLRLLLTDVLGAEVREQLFELVCLFVRLGLNAY